MRAPLTVCTVTKMIWLNTDVYKLTKDVPTKTGAAL